MAQFCAGYHADKNPTLMVAELPFLGIETLEEERAISEALYAHPAVVEDLARWNATLLMPSPMPQYYIIGQGEPPRTLEGFRGPAGARHGRDRRGDAGGGRRAHLNDRPPRCASRWIRA